MGYADASLLYGPHDLYEVSVASHQDRRLVRPSIGKKKHVENKPSVYALLLANALPLYNVAYSQIYSRNVCDQVDSLRWRL